MAMPLLFRYYIGDREKSGGKFNLSFRSLLKQQFLNTPGLYQLSDLVEEGDEVIQFQDVSQWECWLQRTLESGAFCILLHNWNSQSLKR